MLYIIYQEDGPGSKALREVHKPAHFAYLKEHEDILVLGGAMLAEDDEERIGSVLILNVPTGRPPKLSLRTSHCARPEPLPA